MRQRFLKAAMLAAGIVALATPAAAQGFLQQLFGLGGSPQAQPAAPAPLLTPGGRPYTAQSSSNYGGYMSRRPHTDDDEHEQRASGSYRTICVRTCDGYFFPISNSTSKKGFYRDNMKCRSQCGDDARIFFLPVKTLEVDSALDLQGRQYGRMNTAYVYRKTLVAGCQCKPDPWAASELARHRQYADAELEKKLAALPKTETTADAVATAAATDEPKKADASSKSGALNTAGDPNTSRETKVAEAAKAKTSAWKATTTRAAPKPIQQAQRPTAQPPAASSGGFGGSMGLGGAQLTWPGDAPRRP